MKKRVVAKAQKRTRRNKAKYNERVKNRIHSRIEAKKELKYTKEPNRSARRVWDRIIGKGK